MKLKQPYSWMNFSGRPLLLPLSWQDIKSIGSKIQGHRCKNLTGQQQAPCVQSIPLPASELSISLLLLDQHKASVCTPRRQNPPLLWISFPTDSTQLSCKEHNKMILPPFFCCLFFKQICTKTELTCIWEPFLFYDICSFSLMIKNSDTTRGTNINAIHLKEDSDIRISVLEPTSALTNISAFTKLKTKISWNRQIYLWFKS